MKSWREKKGSNSGVIAIVAEEAPKWEDKTSGHVRCVGGALGNFRGKYIS